MKSSSVDIALVYPELLGTYGDRGNAIVLAQRAKWRGLQANILEISAGTTIPDSCDIYLFGGGEDDPQSLAAVGMRESKQNIQRAQGNGAVILAICAGFQLIGHRYTEADGSTLEGIGLIDAETRAGSPRLIGEVVVDPDPSLNIPTLTGFENHGGRTILGPTVKPLGRVRVGGGNGINDVDGALADHLIGTYLHGPLLPRNPALADRILEWVVGDLASLDSQLEEQLRAERLEAAELTGLSKYRYDRHLTHG